MVVIQNGLPIPTPGINEDIDKVLSSIEEVKVYLQSFLQKQRKSWKSSEINYVHTRQRYELEFPDKLIGDKKPKDFAITSKRKGFLRFHTPEIEESLKKLQILEQELQNRLSPFICDYFRMFYSKHSYWQQIINCLGELDCLCSLAKLGQLMNVQCRPQIVLSEEAPVLELEGAIHPILASKKDDNFMPNDIKVKDSARTFLITGANMGGKSTILRQTCLAVIMAQVGSLVPAKSFKLSTVDRIFTRIGASDNILGGKSTFFTEMEETCSIVKEATKRSLVVIDELGRGTSTYDGVAIAYAALKYIIERVGCITLFATHYHLLVEEFRLYDKAVGLYYMESEVNKDKDEVKFLYRFTYGETKESLGVAVAKMAGLPNNVIDTAKKKSSLLTNESKALKYRMDLMENFNKIIVEVSKLSKAKSHGSDENVILSSLKKLI